MNRLTFGFSSAPSLCPPSKSTFQSRGAAYYQVRGGMLFSPQWCHVSVGSRRLPGPFSGKLLWQDALQFHFGIPGLPEFLWPEDLASFELDQLVWFGPFTSAQAALAASVEALPIAA